jgi:hypothetical protein
VCAQFLHEIYSHYIPGFDGKVAVARDSNRVWPISLPEGTDVLIANKIIDRLRHLLHRKLVAEKSKIQEWYNEMRENKRRGSHGELSSSGEDLPAMLMAGLEQDRAELKEELAKRKVEQKAEM